MSFDSQDINLLKEIVEGAVAKATRDLVTKDEFSQFRDEMKAEWDKTYSREMIDQFRRENLDEHNRLWDEVKTNKDVVSKLWENTAIKVGAVFAVLLQAVEIWQLFKR